jgi:hypothetical protein
VGFAHRKSGRHLRRRELLDHVIVLGKRHLKWLLSAVEPRERGRVIAESRVGGVHHRYRRVG